MAHEERVTTLGGGGSGDGDDPDAGAVAFDGGDAPVRLFVSDGVVRVATTASLRDLARRLSEEGVGALVVTDGDTVHGVVSERDVVAAVARGADVDATTAGELDSRAVVSCRPDTSVHDAALLMAEHYVRHLVVDDGSGPVGVVSARDLLGAYTGG